MRRWISGVLAMLMTAAVLGGLGCSSDDHKHRDRDRDRDSDRDDDRHHRSPRGGGAGRNND